MQASITNLPIPFNLENIEKDLTHLLKCKVKATVSTIDNDTVIIKGDIDLFHPEIIAKLVHYFGENSIFHRINDPVKIIIPKLKRGIVCA